MGQMHSLEILLNGQIGTSMVMETTLMEQILMHSQITPLNGQIVMAMDGEIIRIQLLHKSIYSQMNPLSGLILI